MLTGNGLLFAITALYALAAIAFLRNGEWQKSCMMAGPVIINIGILGVQ